MFRDATRVIAATALSCTLTLGCVPALSGCADASSPASQTQGATQGKRFTIPAAYFSSMDAKTAEKRLSEIGATDVQRQDDGSYTVTMSDGSYDSFVADNLETAKRTLESIPGSTTCPSIAKVTMDDDLTQIRFECTKDDIGTQGQDAANLAIYVSCLYQAIAGKDLHCEVLLVAPDGHVIETHSYPES